MSKMCLKKKTPRSVPSKKCSVLQKSLHLWKQNGSYHVQNHGLGPKNHLKYLEHHKKITPELIDCMWQTLICRCNVNIACCAEGGPSIQERRTPLKMHQNQHQWADVGAAARWADIAPCPLVFSRHLFPAFPTISDCSCPCVSEALPAPWTWTGSSPRPETAGGPEPNGALQNGCAGKDCTASLPQWWKDSENRPRVKNHSSATKRSRLHLSLDLFGVLGNKWFLSSFGSMCASLRWSNFISSASSVMALRRNRSFPPLNKFK